MHARPLERFETLDCKLSVARTAGDHDRAGTYTFVVGQLEGEAAWIQIAPVEANHLIRDRHLYPEFLRLIVGTRHQSHAGDAGWEAKVVLDTGRGTGLPAERAAVEH